MSRFGRRFITISSLVVLGMLIAAVLLYRAVDSSIRSSIDFKSAKKTTATIVSTVKSIRSSADSSTTEDVYTVCFTLDSFAQVPAAWRTGYEEAERRRIRANGPHCKVTNLQAAASLRAGDRLQITYLLGNDDNIEIVRIEAGGMDFGAEGATYSGSDHY